MRAGRGGGQARGRRLRTGKGRGCARAVRGPEGGVQRARPLAGGGSGSALPPATDAMPAAAGGTAALAGM